MNKGANKGWEELVHYLKKLLFFLNLFITYKFSSSTKEEGKSFF